MATYSTEINFLASAKNVIAKTASADAVTNAASIVSETDASGVARKILKAGTLYNSTNVVGLVAHDYDLTGTTAANRKEISVVVQGNYIAEKLPKVASETTTPKLSELEAQGLHAVLWVSGTVTRPTNAEEI